MQQTDTIDALTEVFESIWGTRRIDDVQAASRHLLSAVDLEADLVMVEKRKHALLRVSSTQAEDQRFANDMQIASELLTAKTEDFSKKALNSLVKTQKDCVDDCLALEHQIDLQVRPSQLETYIDMQTRAAASMRKATVQGQLGWILDEAQDILNAEFADLERYVEVIDSQGKHKQLEQYFKVEVTSLAKQVSSFKADLIKQSKLSPEMTDHQLQLIRYDLDSLWEQARKTAARCQEVQVATMENVQFIASRAEEICRSPSTAGGAELQELLQGCLFEIVVLKKKLSGSLREYLGELATVKATLRSPLTNKVLKAKAVSIAASAESLGKFLEVNLNMKHSEVAKLKEKLLEIWEALALQADLQISLYELTE